MNRRWVILSVLFILAHSCQEQDHTILDEVIHIRHKGADMPAYTHGNAGSGVFLVVLHGAGSFGLAFRDGSFTNVLEKELAVVYWDQRGQGMSQGHYDQPEDLIGLMAEDVAALVNVLESKYGAENQFFLLGHSWGGLLGATFLLQDRERQNRFSGWISVDGALDVVRASEARRALMLEISDQHILEGANTEEWTAFRDEVALLDSLSDEDYPLTMQYAQQCISLLVKSGTVASTLSPEKLFRAVVDNNPLTWLVSHFFNQPVDAALENNFTVTSRLHEMEIPTLLISGKYDVSVPPAVAEEAFRQLGSEDAFLEIYEHSIHHPHDTEPDRFSEDVLDFIKKYR